MTIVPKTLLVTWTPPGARNVGEIVLRDLCNLLPSEQLVVCEVSDFAFAPRTYEHLQIRAPDEAAWRPLPGQLGALCNFAHIRTVFASAVRRIIPRIIEFAAAQKIERVWITLSSPTLIAIAAELTNRLALPMFALVWDPPAWIARQKGWDRWSVSWILKRFGTALRQAQQVMVVSDEMVEQYEKEWGTPCVIVRHAFPDAVDQDAIARRDPDVFRIGFAGTLYDSGQLNLLLGALHSINWTLDGRRVVLRMIGNYYQFHHLTAPSQVELLGWRDTDETRKLLAECDITYLPVSFQEHFSEFARLAFPTKLSVYLAVGRPVVVHAPAYASAVAFCQQHGFGVTCASMDRDHMRDALVAIGSGLALSERFARAAKETCKALLSEAFMKRQFAKFMQLDERLLR